MLRRIRSGWHHLLRRLLSWRPIRFLGLCGDHIADQLHQRQVDWIRPSARVMDSDAAPVESGPSPTTILPKLLEAVEAAIATYHDDMHFVVTVRVPGDRIQAVATGVTQFRGKARPSDHSAQSVPALIPRAPNGYTLSAGRTPRAGLIRSLAHVQ